jgi:hypothetical protein
VEDEDECADFTIQQAKSLIHGRVGVEFERVVASYRKLAVEKGESSKASPIDPSKLATNPRSIWETLCALAKGHKITSASQKDVEYFSDFQELAATLVKVRPYNHLQTSHVGA